MGFKENLLKKMGIDILAAKVSTSVEPKVDAANFDEDSARRLIKMGGFPHPELKVRTLELYILENDGDKKKIIVLDNALDIYDTTIDDVAMRKSPTLKEIFNLRNARKILSDNDVLVSERTESVRILKKMLIDGLDLTYTQADIDEIANEGGASLASGDIDGVMESLDLFGEMLGFRKPPEMFQHPYGEVRGNLERGSLGEMQFGPAVIYDDSHNWLKFVASTIDSRNNDELGRYLQILKGDIPADADGVDVFMRLSQLVMERKPLLNETS
jgi:hypothetical protein